MDNNPIKTVTFNQDFSCLAIGTSTNYKVYNCDPFGECFIKSDDGGASIVEMLFATSLIAIVGLGDKPSTSIRRLKIINTKRKTIICELTFPTSILSVKLNRRRLIVVLFDQIYIYDVSCMKLLHTIETVPNKQAIVSLSSSDNSILCFPSSSLSIANTHVYGNESPSDLSSSHSNSNIDAFNSDTNNSGNSNHGKNTNQITGSIVVFDALNIQPVNVIQAHKASLAAIALSKDGRLVATASSKGTIIRVFNCFTGKKLHEFRRGSYGTSIHSLNFNSDSSLLCSSSGTETIHIFKLTDEDNNNNKQLFKMGNSQVSTNSDEERDEGTNNEEDEAGGNNSEVAGGDNDEEREERVLPQESQISESESQELLNILNSKNIKDGKHNGRRSSSISEYLWSKSSNITKNVKGQLNNYLPTKVQSMLEPKRDFAFIKLPHHHYNNNNHHHQHNLQQQQQQQQQQLQGGTNGNPDDTGSGSSSPIVGSNGNIIESGTNHLNTNYKTVVGINSNNSYVMVADSLGNFYVYNIPFERGGECVLIKQYSFKYD
ncbi:hypothetical protein PACTADRAFT_83875 [Pachysolen tannophilus NRRL Y-2460]|uniref:Autophagy-related protein 18 n=1 Tax=Pachysolen tannophilus NRRL Y-2460 TaxID=669874 RepID=A0A1E4TXS0_PACTA|nr:hypothetical protein PACTADRAFT_83875 [Pachysolen tannophilus NRRL Y-2460]